MSVLLPSLFYSHPDASKILLDQARNFDISIQTVNPHSYHSSTSFGTYHGAVGYTGFNLVDFNHDDQIQADKRLLFGDLIITCAVVDVPAFYTGLSIGVGSYRSNGDLVSPHGHIVYENSSFSAIGQIDHPQAFLFKLESVWTYGVEFNVFSDATGSLAGQCGVTFNGFKFAR